MIERITRMIKWEAQAPEEACRVKIPESDQNRADRYRREAFKIAGVVRKAGPLNQFDL